MIPLELPGYPGIDLYLKDESSHPTGSLKHRLARSLFLYGLCSGQITEGSTVVEASSGSTAVSEAYFARMLGLLWTLLPSPVVDETTPTTVLVCIYLVAGAAMALTVAVVSGIGALSFLVRPTRTARPRRTPR